MVHISSAKVRGKFKIHHFQELPTFRQAALVCIVMPADFKPEHPFCTLITDTGINLMNVSCKNCLYVTFFNVIKGSRDISLFPKDSRGSQAHAKPLTVYHPHKFLPYNYCCPKPRRVWTGSISSFSSILHCQSTPIEDSLSWLPKFLSIRSGFKAFISSVLNLSGLHL